MKKLLLFLGLFSVFTVCGGEPFEWGLKVEDGVAQIELNVAAENYVYADKLQITVETGTSVLAEPLSAPVPVVELDEVTGLDTAIFPAGEEWRRNLFPADKKKPPKHLVFRRFSHFSVRCLIQSFFQPWPERTPAALPPHQSKNLGG